MNRDWAVTTINNFEYGLENVIRCGMKTEYDREICKRAVALIEKRDPGYVEKKAKRLEKLSEEKFTNIMARECMSYITSNRKELIRELSTKYPSISKK